MIKNSRQSHLQFRTRHKEALDGIKLARELAIWFHSSFGKAGTAFKPGPFVPPGTKPLGKKEHADYVLFIGLTPIAVVEAKKENVNLTFKSERYGRGVQMTPPLMLLVNDASRHSNLWPVRQLGDRASVSGCGRGDEAPDA